MILPTPWSPLVKGVHLLRTQPNSHKKYAVQRKTISLVLTVHPLVSLALLVCEVVKFDIYTSPNGLEAHCPYTLWNVGLCSTHQIIEIILRLRLVVTLHPLNCVITNLKQLNLNNINQFTQTTLRIHQSKDNLHLDDEQSVIFHQHPYFHFGKNHVSNHPIQSACLPNHTRK